MAQKVKRGFGWAALGGLVGAAVLGPLAYLLSEVVSLSQQVTLLVERQASVERRLAAESLRASAGTAERAEDAAAVEARENAAQERLARLESALGALEARSLEPEVAAPAPSSPAQIRVRPVAPPASAKPAAVPKPTALPKPAVRPAIAPKPAVMTEPGSAATAQRALRPQLFAEPAHAVPQQLADRRLGL
jgi:hypothetical protein